MSNYVESASGRQTLDVVIPVFNDWESTRAVLHDLNEQLVGIGRQIAVFLIDDSSSELPEPGWPGEPLQAIESIDVISLRFNVGHQRAIAVGLCHVADRDTGSPVLVMDGDGEDRPSEVSALFEEFLRREGGSIVFAERTRRSEGVVFAIGYHVYRAVHWLLTGIPVRVGNFSILPVASLKRIVYMPELWNHYAAAVFRSGLVFTQVPTVRGTRVSGRSHMTWTSLVTHGLSALAVFGGIVGVRLMLIALTLLTFILVGLAAVLASTFWTGASFSSEAIMGVGMLLLLMSQVVMAASGLALFILNSRSDFNSFPLRDYRNLIGQILRIYPNGN